MINHIALNHFPDMDDMRNYLSMDPYAPQHQVETAKIEDALQRQFARMFAEPVFVVELFDLNLLEAFDIPNKAPVKMFEDAVSPQDTIARLRESIGEEVRASPIHVTTAQQRFKASIIKYNGLNSECEFQVYWYSTVLADIAVLQQLIADERYIRNPKSSYASDTNLVKLDIHPDTRFPAHPSDIPTLIVTATYEGI